MRLRKLKNLDKRLEASKELIIQDGESYKGRWKFFFGNDNPVHLEIGMGKGKFIRENARRNPNINYIGCELSTSMCYKSAKEVVDLNNLKILNYDAFKLEEVFEDGEINTWKTYLKDGTVLNYAGQLKNENGLIVLIYPH